MWHFGFGGQIGANYPIIPHIPVGWLYAEYARRRRRKFTYFLTVVKRARDLYSSYP